MAKKNISKLLTEVELEFMNILWKLGEGTVHQVIEHLPKQRDLAYNSVSTILRILEQKAILKSEKIGRGHIYIPTIKKNEYEQVTVNHMVEKLFDGSHVSVVRQLLDSKNISEQELIEIKKIIENRMD